MSTVSKVSKVNPISTIAPSSRDSNINTGSVPKINLSQVDRDMASQKREGSSFTDQCETAEGFPAPPSSASLPKGLLEHVIVFTGIS